jgi:3-oxoacyl-[acyl-carrier protein] reductase
MNLDLSGRRAIVCGSTSGIGRACAIELARLHASVTLLSRNEDRLKAELGSLPRSRTDQHHDYIAADLHNPEQVRALVLSRLDDRGEGAWLPRPTILINNTGGPPPGPAFEADPAHLLDAFNAQLLSAHALARTLLPCFREHGYGRIINITSTSVKQPIPNLGISNIIRPAVAAWGKCLATELGHLGVTVNNVLPGYTATDRLEQLVRGRAAKQGVDEDRVRNDLIAATPAGRFGTPEEIAAVVAFLASPAAAYVNGVNIPVDGGRLGTL